MPANPHWVCDDRILLMRFISAMLLVGTKRDKTGNRICFAGNVDRRL